MAEGNGNGWRTAALGVLFAVVMAFAGWGMTDSQTMRSETRNELAELRKQAAQDRERIATLEEGMRQAIRSLDRIEAGVDELLRVRRR